MALRIACCVDPRYAPARQRARGMAAVAQERDWRMNLIPHRGAAALAAVQSWACDGVLAWRADVQLVRWCQCQGVPLVDSARDASGRVPFVSVDEEALGRSAAAHLCALGDRHLFFCGIGSNAVSRLRGRAFANAAGRAVRQWNVRDEEVSEGPGRLRDWLRRQPLPAACLCQDDQVAQRLLLAASQLGIPVPEQLAVLGIGDDPLLAGLSSPPLSSIRMPALAIGRASAEMLGCLLAGTPPADTAVGLPPVGITVRASTSAMASEHPAVAAALGWIAAHGCGRIGVADVAAAVGHSRRSLERWFHLHLHRSIGQEIQRVRMQRAHDLLVAGGVGMAAVATACGYADHAAFSRAFRAWYGRAPLMHRRLARGSG